MTQIAAVHPVLAPHEYPQTELTEAFGALCGLDDRARRLLDRLHRSTMVHTRHLALPLEQYGRLDGFGDSNDAFIDVAVELGEQAISGALDKAGLRADQVDLVVSTSVTGLAVPSIDARLAGRLGMREDVDRLPLFGLGCVGGAAGLARCRDYLRAWPDRIAVLLAVELCSLTLRRSDPAVANLVASGLFGDGAAAVVLRGAQVATDSGGVEVAATKARLYPDTERVMGWDIGAEGFGVVLSPDVPDVVRRHIGHDVKGFLTEHGIEPADIASWVCHPGGPKVLEAVADALALPPDALELTWRSLARIGNLSSASVLHVLADTLEQRPRPPGTPGLLLAMGPGFCAELVLLTWR